MPKKATFGMAVHVGCQNMAPSLWRTLLWVKWNLGIYYVSKDLLMALFVYLLSPYFSLPTQPPKLFLKRQGFNKKIFNNKESEAQEETQSQQNEKQSLFYITTISAFSFLLNKHSDSFYICFIKAHVRM